MNTLFSLTRRNRGRASFRTLGIALTLALFFGSLIQPVRPVRGAEDEEPTRAQPIQSGPVIQINPEVVAEEEPPTEEVSLDGPLDEPREEAEAEPTAIDGEDTFADPVVEIAPESSDVYINKLVCPNDFGRDYGQLLANCGGAQEEFTFTLQPSGIVLASNGTTYSAVGIAPGYIEIYEDVPEGFGTPIVFCKTIWADDSETAPVQLDSTYGAIWYDLPAASTLSCDWFNIRPVSSDLIVQKFNCPEGIAESGSYDDFIASCTELADGVSFALDGLDSGPHGQQVTDAAGFAYWAVPAPDHYLITEKVPDGYGRPVVFCDTDWVREDPDLNMLGFEVSDQNRIELDVIEDVAIFCVWFNLPAVESTVIVEKYNCPGEVVGIFDVFMANCTEAGAGVGFSLDGDAGYHGERETDADGYTRWGSLEADEYVLTEDVPDGYGTPVVFCAGGLQSRDLHPEVFEYSVSDENGIEFSVAEGTELVCYWFNIPEAEDGSITIYKWLCPEGFDLYGDDAEAVCTTPQDGVTFEANGPGGYHGESITSSSIPGGVAFGGLEAGVYEITEHKPVGTNYGFVVDCEGSAAPVPDVFPRYNTEWGGPFAIEIYEGEDVVCNWYNVPYETVDTSKITVVKYLCDTYVSDLTCAIYTGGQEFTLTSTADPANTTTFVTGADGTKTLVVTAGEWILDEVGGEWCLAESDDLNQYGQIVASEGHETVVTVYNCATHKDPPTKDGPPTVTKFPNTGSGAAFATTGAPCQTLVLLVLAQGLILVALRRRAAHRR